MIEVYNLCVKKGNKEILKGVSMEVDKSEAVVLIGENGSGKTTLIRAISGLEDYKGEIYIDGFEPEKGGSEKISVLSQDFNPVGYLKVSEIMGFCDFIDEEIIKELGLNALFNSRVGNLSGGERRRVGIGFALMNDRPYIILDEPTANLDISYINRLINLLRRKVEEGKGLLIATHDILFAREVGDRFVFLRDGKVLYTTNEEGFNYACTKVFGTNMYTEVMKRCV